MWTGTITVVAALTMTIGALRALFETDLKRVLAYSTISALGILMLLFGIGTPQAVTAGLVYLLAHACYKGALFLVAGAVEHETGTRDVARARRTAPGDAADGHRRGARGRFDGRHAAVRRLHRQGAVLRQRRRCRRCPASGAVSSSSLAVAASMCLGAAGLIAGIAPFRGRSIAGTGRPTMRRRRCGWGRWSWVRWAWFSAFCRHWPRARSLSRANP